ncbi:MAG: DUF2812 domain-containing protein [Oscillospiraceae bacterium]|nr:DUF2812 domain-containing protein [Oscillospiraceae bacterium]
MAKDRKSSWQAYVAWDYEKELEDLDRASQEGWQLVRGGCFHNKFVKNPQVRYRYQLDYGRIDDMGRYIETFREQGWEYVNSTFNGWHYFRKAWDPALPESAYEIYTDRSSLPEMEQRWARIAGIVGMVLLGLTGGWLWSTIRQPQLPHLIMFLTLAVEAGFLLRGWVIMRSSNSPRKRGGESRMFLIFLAVILLGVAASITLTYLRPHFTTSQQASSVEFPVEDKDWQDFAVKYPDNYFLDLKMQAEEPITFSILNEAGETVFTKTETDFEAQNLRIRLPAGEYRYRLSLSGTGGFLVECELE